MKKGKDKQAAGPKAIDRAAAKQLVALMQRFDRLYDEAQEHTENLKELRAEAKSLGYDVKAVEGLVKKKRKDPKNEKIKQDVEEVYLHALRCDLGELGRWASERLGIDSRQRAQAAVATMDATSGTLVDAFAVSRGLDEDGSAAARLMEGADA